MIAYKVLVRDSRNGKLYSYFAHGKARVEYRPNRWTRTKRWLSHEGYHLLAFRQQYDATLFLNRFLHHYHELWKVEIEDLVNLPPLKSLCSLSVGIFQRKSYDTWPQGTIMGKRIRLLERVDHEQGNIE